MGEREEGKRKMGDVKLSVILIGSILSCLLIVLTYITSLFINEKYSLKKAVTFQLISGFIILLIQILIYTFWRL
jgi:hypothetical protein